MGVELMAEEVQDVSVVLSKEQSPTSSQPANQPSEVKLDKATVRAATIEAAKQGLDPFNMTVGDLTAPPQGPVEVPPKFKKPTGEVDVEKLKTSTERLDEAIEKKTEEIRSIEDYVKAYKEKEVKLRGELGPKLAGLRQEAASISPPQVPVQQVPMDPMAIRARIEADFERDKVGTIADLVDIIVAQRMSTAIAPTKEYLEQMRIDKQDQQLRNNLQALADKDPRVLNPKVFAAITAKLDADPDLWKLQNPHKAAWLDVKDELRLGDAPTGVSAQPSRVASPILGGGTPPPAPSSSDGTLSVDMLLKAAGQLGRDPRDVKYDPKQAANMRLAAKQIFDQMDRQARR